MKNKDELINKLKKVSLKITPKRLALIGLLTEESQFLTVKEIHKKIQKTLPGINLTTVYRNIETFDRHGLLVKSDLNNRETGYALCKIGEEVHHHHIVCSRCGKFSSLYCCNFDQIVEELKQVTGFTDIKHKIEFEGTCPECMEDHSHSKGKDLQIFISP